MFTLYPCRSDIGKTAHCSKPLEHEVHQHSLFLAPSSIQLCNSCEGPKGTNHVFVCKECDFALGFECSTLPLKVKYEHDPHLFSLAYTAKNDYKKYYCLICEEERNKNYWFYYCERCDFTAHPRCIVGRYPYIRYGRDFTWKNHQHLLNWKNHIRYGRDYLFSPKKKKKKSSNRIL
jgi:hypothetical protein